MAPWASLVQFSTKLQPITFLKYSFSITFLVISDKASLYLVLSLEAKLFYKLLYHTVTDLFTRYRIFEIVNRSWENFNKNLALFIQNESHKAHESCSKCDIQTNIVIQDLLSRKKVHQIFYQGCISKLLSIVIFRSAITTNILELISRTYQNHSLYFILAWMHLNYSSLIVPSWIVIEILVVGGENFKINVVVD